MQKQTKQNKKMKIIYVIIVNTIQDRKSKVSLFIDYALK